MNTIPEEVMSKLNDLPVLYGIPEKIVKDLYKYVYESLSDQEFPDEKEKHYYCFQLFYVKYFSWVKMNSFLKNLPRTCKNCKDIVSVIKEYEYSFIKE